MTAASARSLSSSRTAEVFLSDTLTALIVKRLFRDDPMPNPEAQRCGRAEGAGRDPSGDREDFRPPTK